LYTGFLDFGDFRSDFRDNSRVLGRISDISGISGMLRIKSIPTILGPISRNWLRVKDLSDLKSDFMDLEPDFRDLRSDMKGFRPYLRDFTSDFKVFMPCFIDFWSDFTDYRALRDRRVFRLDLRNFTSNFRTLVHRISTVIGPLVSISSLCIDRWALG